MEKHVLTVQEGIKLYNDPNVHRRQLIDINEDLPNTFDRMKIVEYLEICVNKLNQLKDRAVKVRSVKTEVMTMQTLNRTIYKINDLIDTIDNVVEMTEILEKHPELRR